MEARSPRAARQVWISATLSLPGGRKHSVIAPAGKRKAWLGEGDAHSEKAGPPPLAAQPPVATPAATNPLDRWFEFGAAGSSVGTELRAGVATFLTMAYIMFVNPAILAQTGTDHGAVFVATCLAAAAGSLLMGLLANYPIALAPGMGLNAYFAFTIVPELGGNWQLALGCVFVSGVLFFLLSLSPLRAWLIDAIPMSLKLGLLKLIFA